MLRLAITTSAPRPANASAISRPMPRPPPVTTTTRPSKRPGANVDSGGADMSASLVRRSMAPPTIRNHRVRGEPALGALEWPRVREAQRSCVWRLNGPACGRRSASARPPLGRSNGPAGGWRSAPARPPRGPSRVPSLREVAPEGSIRVARPRGKGLAIALRHPPAASFETCAIGASRFRMWFRALVRSRQCRSAQAIGRIWRCQSEPTSLGMGLTAIGRCG
jgi:hypothetical protein